jgi:hypothetical protein
MHQKERAMNTSADQSASMTPTSHPGDERTVNGLATDVPPDQDNLAPCAATFCDGDLARYRELYNVVVRSESEQPNHATSVFSTWRGQLVDAFGSLRCMTRHIMHASGGISNEDALGKAATIE